LDFRPSQWNKRARRPKKDPRFRFAGATTRAITVLLVTCHGVERRREGDVQYAFEDYVIDSDRRELTRSAEPIPVGPQVFDLLLHLVRNREHVVQQERAP
jgi:DNA-binding response OmpR family regulator